MAQFDNEDEQDELDKLNQQKNAEALAPIESNSLSDEMENPELAPESEPTEAPAYAPKENLLKSYQALKPKVAKKTDETEDQALDSLVKENAEEDDSQALDDLTKEKDDEVTPVEAKKVPEIKSSETDPSRKAFDPSELLGLYQSLKPAQLQQQKALGNIGMLTGANQIAQGFARGHGGNIGEGEVGINALKAQAAAPVEAIKQQLDSAKEAMGTSKMARDYQETEKMADPKSAISDIYKNRVVDAMIKQNPTLNRETLLNQFKEASALQMEKMMTKGGILNNGRQGYTTVRGLLTSDGHMINQIPATGEYEDGQTHRILGPNDKVINAVARLDPLDNQYKNAQPGSLPTLGSEIKKREPTGDIVSVKNPITGKIEQNREYTATDLNRMQTKFTDDYLTPVSLKINNDPTINGLYKLNQAASTMLAKLEPDPKTGKVDSGNLPAIRGQYTQMATGGPATDSALHEIQGAGGTLNEMDQALKNLLGEVNEQNIDFFKKATYKFQKVAQQVANDKTKTDVNLIKSRFPEINLTDDNVRKILGIQDLMRNSAIEESQAKDADKNNKKSVPQGKIWIKGPSGKVAQMDKEKAKTYLSLPGYTEVK